MKLLPFLSAVMVAETRSNTKANIAYNCFTAEVWARMTWPLTQYTSYFSETPLHYYVTLLCSVWSGIGGSVNGTPS